MEVTGETCTLCLKYVQDTNFITLDETILGKLSFLQMDLDQTMEESESLCKECEKKIEHAFEFKSCLVNTESCLVPYLTNDRSQKINIRLIIEKDGPSTSKIEASVDKEVCRLCKKLVNTTSVISLAKVLKDDSIMDVFHGHIPEMDLEVTENPTVCITCHQSLSHFSTLIGSWSIAKSWNDNDEDMKEDYNDFKVEVKNEKLDDVSDSNTNSSSSMLDSENSVKTPNEIDINIKTESPPFTGDVFVSNKQIKKEEPESDTAIREVHLESEEVDIKDEEGMKKPLKKSDIEIKCEKCEFKTYYRKSLRRHLKIHERRGELLTYNCQRCSFQTTSRNTLRDHMTEHKLHVYKCDHCTFETKIKNTMAKHVLKHKDFNEVESYQCLQCNYRTKYKSALNRHMTSGHRKHVNDIVTYQCAECEFRTKYSTDLRKHKLLHQKSGEASFKCQACSYTTNHQTSLTKHVDAVHNREFNDQTNLLKKFICEQCAFETTRKTYLDRHKKVHKNLGEVRTYKCHLCPYETKIKGSLKSHSITHEVPSYECTECSYKTKSVLYLKQHMLRHVESDQLERFKCEQCNYEAKLYRYLRIHVKRVHGKPADQPFKCSQCVFETNTKTCLDSHVRMHRTIHEVKYFKCPLCPVVTRYSTYLTRHMKKHEAAEKAASLFFSQRESGASDQELQADSKL